MRNQEDIPEKCKPSIDKFEIESVFCQECGCLVHSYILRDGKPTGREIPHSTQIKCLTCGTENSVTYYLEAPPKVREWYDRKYIMGES